MSKNNKNKGAIRKDPEGTPPEGDVTTPPEGDDAEAEKAKAEEEKAAEAEEEKKAKAAEAEEEKKAKAAEAARDRRTKERLAKEAEAEAAAKRGCFIEDGKSVTSNKGILGPGVRVLPEYWGVNGEEILKNLIAGGMVKEVK